MPQAQVRVVGLNGVRRDLRRLGDTDTLAELRVGLRAAAEIVAVRARQYANTFSFTAADTIRATAGVGRSGARAFVVGGKNALPWYGWADFGSRTPVTGNPRSVGPWAGSGRGPKDGRFIYPAIKDTRPLVVSAAERAVGVAIKKRGF